MHTLLSHVSLLKHLSPSSLVVKLLAAPDQAKRQIHLPVQAKLPTNRHTLEDRWVAIHRYRCKANSMPTGFGLIN